MQRRSVVGVIVSIFAVACMSSPSTATQKADPLFVRVAGDTRYATAAAMSKWFFPAGADNVFVVSGENWPDAVAVAPLAAKRNAPVLLTQSNTVPRPTIDELTRLHPKTVTFVGGTGVIGDNVMVGIAALTGTTPTRIAGTNRYGTAAAIAEAGWPGQGARWTGGRVYFDHDNYQGYVTNGTGGPVGTASGDDWLDALLHSAFVGSHGRPLLLTHCTTPVVTDAHWRVCGSADAPTETRDEWIRLAPKSNYIGNSTDTPLLNAAWQADLANIQDYPLTTQGVGYLPEDLYGRAEARWGCWLYNQWCGPTAPDGVIVISSTAWPDALVAATYAAIRNYPLYPMQATCVPGPIIDAIWHQKHPGVIIGVGGTAAIANGAIGTGC